MSNEPAEVPCVGAVVHDERGRLLLVRRGHDPGLGLWSLPGGRVEPGESDAAAVVREVAEETGLRVRAGALVGRVRVPGSGVVFTVADYTCRLDGPGQRPVAGDDAADVGWFEAAGLAALDCTPGLLAALTEWAVLPR